MKGPNLYSNEKKPLVLEVCIFYAGMARVHEWLSRLATPWAPDIKRLAGQNVTFDIKRISQRIMNPPAPCHLRQDGWCIHVRSKLCWSGSL